MQQPNIIKQRRPSIKSQKNSKSENNITNGNNNHDKDFNNRKNDSEYNGSNKITIIVVKWLVKQTTKNWSGKNAWKYLLLKVTNTTAKKKLKNNPAT